MCLANIVLIATGDVYPRSGFVIQIKCTQNVLFVYGQSQLEVLVLNLPVTQNQQLMKGCLDHQLHSLVQHKDSHCQHSG